jgi:hypothetical protein
LLADNLSTPTGRHPEGHQRPQERRYNMVWQSAQAVLCMTEFRAEAERMASR